MDDRVRQAAFAQTQAGPGVEQEVRRPAHALHAAGDQAVASSSAMRAAPRWIASSPDAQTLLIVVAEAAGRQPGPQRGLAGGRLAGAGLKHLAHEDFFDQLGPRPERASAALDRDGAQLGRRQAGQAAEKLADRCPRRANQQALPWPLIAAVPGGGR